MHSSIKGMFKVVGWVVAVLTTFVLTVVVAKFNATAKSTTKFELLVFQRVNSTCHMAREMERIVKGGVE